MRHGCPKVWIALCVAVGTLPASAQTPRVRTRTFDIEYHVNDEALPLDAVQLWYTQDDGKTWHDYGFDEDRQSPFEFHAPDEGSFGFFLVMTNSTGASSAAPAAGKI